MLCIKRILSENNKYMALFLDLVKLSTTVCLLIDVDTKIRNLQMYPILVNVFIFHSNQFSANVFEKKVSAVMVNNSTNIN